MGKVIDRFSSIIRIAFLVVVVLLALAALLLCFVYPVGLVGNYKLDTSLPSSHYQLASGAVVLILIGVILSLGHRLLGLLDSVSIASFRIAIAGLVFLAGAVWVAVIADMPPIADEWFCLQMAKAFAAGSLGGLDSAAVAEYFAMYPYQAGFSLWICVWGTIFGIDNYLAIRLINVFCATVSVVLVARIAYGLFESYGVEKIALVFLASFLPLIMLSDFFYGYIPSMTFGFGAICALQSFLKATHGSRWMYASLLFGLLVMAVWLKANSMIIAIAIVVVLWAEALRRGSWSFAIFGVCLTVGLLLVKDLPSVLMMQRVGEFRASPMPSAAWIAMGLQDGPRSEGSYNGYNVGLYREFGGNPEAIAQEALRDIQARVLFFLGHPVEALDFFGSKVSKEWCDPSFQAIVYSFKGLVEYPDWSMGPIAESFYSGYLRKATTLWCDVHQTLVYALAVLGIVVSKKAISQPGGAVLPLAFLGGFLCFVIWEGKSIAVLPYYVCLLPFSAYGAFWLLNGREKGCLDRLICQRCSRRQNQRAL